MSRTAIVILAIVSTTVGAAGTFLALRTGAPTASAAEQVQADPPTVPGAVAESEGIIDPAPVAAPAAPVVAEPQPRRAAPTRPEPRTAARRTASTSRAPEPEPAPPAVAPDHRTVVPIAPAAITDNQASRTVEPPAPLYEELVVAADSVIGLQLESPVSSDKAQVEDSITARVTRDVRVGDRVAIPAGAKAIGEVTLVERGGKLRDRARLGVRFTSVVLADGTRLPLRTETIYREGDPPGRESAAKIGGGAIGGAIIGGILGGAKGAAIGGSIGAGAGTTAVIAGDRNHATLSAGTPLTVRIEEPVVVTVEK